MFSDARAWLLVAGLALPPDAAGAFQQPADKNALPQDRQQFGVPSPRPCDPPGRIIVGDPDTMNVDAMIREERENTPSISGRIGSGFRRMIDEGLKSCTGPATSPNLPPAVPPASSAASRQEATPPHPTTVAALTAQPPLETGSPRDAPAPSPDSRENDALHSGLAKLVAANEADRAASAGRQVFESRVAQGTRFMIDATASGTAATAKLASAAQPAPLLGGNPPRPAAGPSRGYRSSENRPCAEWGGGANDRVCLRYHKVQR